MKKLIYILVMLAFVSSVSGQWSEQTSPVSTALNSVSPVDSINVWICGASGKVLRTTNGGTNWVVTNSPNSTLNLNIILGYDANNAVVSGSTGSMAYVYKTINGGTNWIQVLSQSNTYFKVLTKIHTGGGQWISMLVGDAIGGRFSAWRSTNDGINWDSTGSLFPQQGSEQLNNNSYYMNYNEWNEHTHIYYGTNSSRIYYQTGNNYYYSLTQNLTDINSIYFVDAIQGIAGGSGFNRTLNGGVNWISATFPGTGNCYGIVGAGQEVWYCRGAAGSSGIYYSSNSGNSFASVYTAPNGYYTHMVKAMINYWQRGNIWAIRNNGGITKFSSTVGINQISTEIPSSYSLSQNYPNPFNPTTKIKFDIPVCHSSGSWNPVQLIVYDIQGRNVATLVNESLKPGTYEASFDASSVTSGAYFYKLTSGDFVETRKMILIK